MNRPLAGIFALLILIFQPCPTMGENTSRYVTLQYHGDTALLYDFNEKVILPRQLRYYLDESTGASVKDDVLAKLDIITEQVETVLDMFPTIFHINIVLLPTADNIVAIYKQKYGKDINIISYYSLKEKTIYVSVDDVSLQIISHEIAHAIIDHYFDVRPPPYTMHELMAKYAEQHVTD